MDLTSPLPPPPILQHVVLIPRPGQISHVDIDTDRVSPGDFKIGLMAAVLLGERDEMLVAMILDQMPGEPPGWRHTDLALLNATDVFQYGMEVNTGERVPEEDLRGLVYQAFAWLNSPENNQRRREAIKDWGWHTQRRTEYFLQKLLCPRAEDYGWAGALYQKHIVELRQDLVPSEASPLTKRVERRKKWLERRLGLDADTVDIDDIAHAILHEQAEAMGPRSPGGAPQYRSILGDLVKGDGLLRKLREWTTGQLHRESIEENRTAEGWEALEGRQQVLAEGALDLEAVEAMQHPDVVLMLRRVREGLTYEELGEQVGMTSKTASKQCRVGVGLAALAAGLVEMETLDADEVDVRVAALFLRGQSVESVMAQHGSSERAVLAASRRVGAAAANIVMGI